MKEITIMDNDHDDDDNLVPVLSVSNKVSAEKCKDLKMVVYRISFKKLYCIAKGWESVRKRGGRDS